MERPTGRTAHYFECHGNTMMRKPVRAQFGFTLVELLVALALLAITAALSFRGLTAVGEHRNRVEGQRLRSVQIEQTFAQLQADVDHLMSMSGTPSSQAAPPAMQRTDGYLFLRRPRVLINDSLTQSNSNEAIIDAIRYQATNTGLVRSVVGRARDPIDLLARVLKATVILNDQGEATDGLSRVTLLPEARAIEVLAWSLPLSKGAISGGDWIALNDFNNAFNNPQTTTQGAPTPTPTASVPASSPSAPVPGLPGSTAETPRALKVRIKLENGAILERIYMAGPNG
jgi:prepilin-type N-terminal cleavage/methylation domain-containing protein